MKRLVVGLLLAVCALLLVSSVSAQGTVDTCFGLAAEDCAVIGAAARNTENVTSFNLNYTFDLSITGLESLATMDASIPSAISASATGTGAFTVNSALQSQFEMSLFTDGSVTVGEDTIGGPINFVIADDVVYFQNPETMVWEGQAFSEISSGLDQLGQLGGLPVDPTTMVPTDPTQLTEAADPTAIFEQLAAIGLDPAALVTIPGFITYTRAADTTYGGVSASPFSFTADLTTLFNSAQFAQTLSTLSAAVAQEDPEAAQGLALAPLLLSQTQLNVNVTQFVTVDGFVNGLTLDMTGALNIGMLAGSATAPPIAFDISFGVELTDLNSAIDVVAPEGAVMTGSGM
jgi:hypothetical protein